jgi:hypothetical protein
MDSESRQVVKRLTVENTLGRPLTFVLEPWAEEFPMPAGARYIVEGDGPSDCAEFSVTQEGDYLVVWAWDGSDARVLNEAGAVVSDWTGIRVPNFRALDSERRDAP